MPSVIQSTGDGIQFVTLDKCVAWKVSLDYSAPPNKTVNIYQLCKDGEPITDIMPIEACENGEEFTIDFTDIVEKNLSTSIPDCTNQSVAKDEEASAVFELKLGSVMINNEDCEEEADPIDLASQLSTAGEMTVINSYCNDGEVTKGSSNTLILSNRPERYSQCWCQKDWLYVYGSFNVSVTVFDKSGNQIPGAVAIGASTASDCVSMIPIGVQQLSNTPGLTDLSQVGHFRVKIGVYEYYVYVKKCCCDPNCKMDVYALEPKGGFSLVSALNCIESIDTQKTGRQICIQEDCFGTPEENSRNGWKWLQDQAFAIYRAKGDINIPPKQIPFMVGIGVAAAYAVRPPCTNRIINAAISNENMKVFSKKGKTPIDIPVAVPIKTHKYN